MYQLLITRLVEDMISDARKQGLDELNYALRDPSTYWFLDVASGILRQPREVIVQGMIDQVKGDIAKRTSGKGGHLKTGKLRESEPFVISHKDKAILDKRLAELGYQRKRTRPVVPTRPAHSIGAFVG